eukprot:jgi/Chlat1/4469/Chrsp29S08889
MMGGTSVRPASAAAPVVGSPALAQLLQRKEKLEDELWAIERQIYEMESSYLQDSSQTGNVFKGYDGFLSATSKASSMKRARGFKVEDRLFSLSSITSPAVEELAGKEGR